VAAFLIHSVNVGFLEEVVTLRYRMDFQPLKDRLKMFAEGSEKKSSREIGETNEFFSFGRNRQILF
jgi:hypothetical protein